MVLVLLRALGAGDHRGASSNETKQTNCAGTSHGGTNYPIWKVAALAAEMPRDYLRTGERVKEGEGLSHASTAIWRLLCARKARASRTRAWTGSESTRPPKWAMGSVSLVGPVAQAGERARKLLGIRRRSVRAAASRGSPARAGRTWHQLVF